MCKVKKKTTFFSFVNMCTYFVKRLDRILQRQTRITNNVNGYIVDVCVAVKRAVRACRAGYVGRGSGPEQQRAARASCVPCGCSVACSTMGFSSPTPPLTANSSTNTTINHRQCNKRSHV
ncbi:unnamed protein product [Chrysodeixis includens]|uniref:Uncharacterized protein n=1 Tax=Chrysodeixis includens TaxID=689277 RepID=A0A9N8KTZ0_CHRIL|nr:unnamed protein product [Chrysodeixis includens]